MANQSGNPPPCPGYPGAQRVGVQLGPGPYPPALNHEGYAMDQGGYLPSQRVYPQSQGGHPLYQGPFPTSQEGYPPSQGGNLPSQGGNPTSQELYPSPQQGYLPSQGGNPPFQGPYPPPQQSYPPSQECNYPSQGPYSPPQQGNPPSQGGNPPSQEPYPPPQQGYPLCQGGNPSSQGVYTPPGVYPPPVVQQPMSGIQPQASEDGWMSLPTGNPANCPSGLEYLTTIDQLLVQRLEVQEDVEEKKQFIVKNSLGQKVFYAVQQLGCCTWNCCGLDRPFGMKILDKYQNEIIHMVRPIGCDACCFPCCLHKIEVYAPPGCLVGSVMQQWSILTPVVKPSFDVKDSAGDRVLLIKGRGCIYSTCRDVEFKVLSKDGQTVVGKISKMSSALLRQAFIESDYFGITFPIDLDVRMKAVMLGACFLIHAIFFEFSEEWFFTVLENILPA